MSGSPPSPELSRKLDDLPEGEVPLVCDVPEPTADGLGDPLDWADLGLWTDLPPWEDEGAGQFVHLDAMRPRGLEDLPLPMDI